ncbi:pyridoxamine 5'-phosphate oxidase family protein [Vannielia litorea]|uniref:Pyridoxamine 5'-phosphate oxidase N-terminal domain-containing protein n=1 Tax=Vannielia litorea TaxID=1217970 RepID=A0A1N6HI26_9RHOB|nr:pyridoxamine 5'-phosphate oxidase family protein [Vannielia litorea]SIO19412.1 hypothetical protein SAMN05444002_3395 [Vannielia litorea]
MTQRYHDLMFTPAVLTRQEQNGSRAAYARDAPAPGPDRLTGAEIRFIMARDSFYMATNGADGWPHLQHRGGPKGFVRVIDESTLAFADFRGNRQFITLGNLDTDDRASLFFVDYPARARLKLLCHVRAVSLEGEPELAEALALPGYRAHPERAFLMRVEAFDWNCSQHITPRFTEDEIIHLGA